MTKEAYFQWVSPDIPSYHDMFMLEGMTYKSGVKIPTGSICQPQDLTVQVWTDQCDKDCPDHKWHAFNLSYVKHDENEKVHIFASTAVITSDKDFGFTFRMKIDGGEWVWRGGWKGDGFAHVNSPRDNDKWTQGPDWNHIIGGVHLGNFIAATNAIECGFSHVLNVAEDRDMIYPKDSTIVYKKVPMRDGAHNPIPGHKIAEAVQWLQENDKGEVKILVNCRAGIGRAGSVLVSYVFAKYPTMSFEDAYNFVFQKRFVYPHAGLREILYERYTRKM